MQEIKRLGQGGACSPPQENEGGRAIVQMLVNGVETEYAIQRQAAEVGQTEHGEVDIEEVAEEEKEDVIKILK